MNENSGTTCLVITEKKSQQQHRPGGCVGIFFQLFDWNRRLAKKKLFSRKLLPLPARAKQASKRFGANDKLPASAKLHLIADENRGGFPTAKKSGIDNEAIVQKHEMRPAGLVAKLMGLESMPTVRREKPKKALGSEICNNRDDKFVGNAYGCENGDVILEKAQMKHELRPQKLRKTSNFDRRAVTRFGAEALQFRSVLSRSRKHHHHPKLASPVKGPKVFSGRKNSSRLIDVATKILEPGLQATNRAKNTLTYSNYESHHSKDRVMIGGSDIPNQVDCYANAISSCKSCGNPLDILDHRSSAEEYPSLYAFSVSNHVNASSQGSNVTRPNPPLSSLQLDRNEVSQYSHVQTAYLASQELNHVQSHSEPAKESRALSRDGLEQWRTSGQLRKPQQVEQVFTPLKHVNQTPNHMSVGKERIPPRSKFSNVQNGRVSSAVNDGVSGSKDFVALNRSLSGRTRSRIPNNVNSLRFETDKSCSKKNDSSLQVRTPPRKRRTTSNGLVESRNFVDSTLGKLGDNSSNRFSGKKIELNGRPLKQTCNKNRYSSLGGGNNANTNKNMDVISFTFSSPVKHKTEILCPKDRDRDRTYGNSEKRKLRLNENDAKTPLQKPLSLGGDALGALLEQKLQELTRQEEDELATGDTPPKKTTAMILQELISALTAEHPISREDENLAVRQNGHVFLHDHQFDSVTTTPKQAKIKITGSSVLYPCDADHFSPGSILEASFSNSSCISSSLDDCSGHQTHHDSMDSDCDLPQSLVTNTDLWDSATSLDGSRIVTHLVNHISSLVNSLDQFGARLTGSKLIHVKDVLLNAELFCGIGVVHNLDEMEEFSVGQFLLHELENLANFIWTKSNCLFGFEAAKQGNRPMEFLFDCVIEYLDLYDNHCKSGFKAWKRLPLCLNVELLIQGIEKEIRKWADLAGKLPDDIIEWEMSHSLGKWTDFEIEAFETGIEIDRDLLQSLVDEIVSDLYRSSLESI